MIERMIKKAATQITNDISSKINEATTTKTEWHRFSCGVGHSFAIELSTDIPLDHIVGVYNATSCPLCNSRQLKKQTNL